MKMQPDTPTDEIEQKAQSKRSKNAPFHSLKRRWKSDKLMSLIALLISVGTFITFAYQNYLIQKQQYRSVMPYLMINRHYASEPQPTVSLQLFNNGVGPAFVENLKILYKGKEYSTVYDFFLNGIHAETPIRCSYSEIPEGYAIPANQFFDILTSIDSTSAQVLGKVLDETQIEITYSSLYDEQWKVVFGKQSSTKPIPID